MALSGEDDKEMRIPVPVPIPPVGSLSYDPHENLDHNTPHPLPPHHHNLDQSRAGSKSRSPMGTSTTSVRLTSSSSSTSSIRYRECLKNHAASTGGNVTDGCGEFMPSGEDGTLEALKCAACDCHRNFHRKESLLNNTGSGTGGGGSGAVIVHPNYHHHHPPPHLTPSASMNHHHHHHHQRHVAEPIPLNSNHWTAGMVQPVKMAFGNGGGGGSGSGGTDSSSEELNFYTYQSTSVQPPPQYVLAKKRFRTKFTADQKEKMMAFAEKLGWRIPREDDTEVQRFCAEVGVKRQVFKVWMHNNKNNSSSGKKNPDENNNNNNHHEI